MFALAFDFKHHFFIREQHNVTETSVCGITTIKHLFLQIISIFPHLIKKAYLSHIFYQMRHCIANFNLARLCW